MDFVGDNWLSESLTQYVTLDYLERKYGADDNLFPGDAGPAGALARRLLAYGSFRERLVSPVPRAAQGGLRLPGGKRRRRHRTRTG